MLKVKNGDRFQLDIYYIKEHKLVDAVGKDGIVNKIPIVEAKFLINPSDEYLNKPNVEVVAKRTIVLQIAEVNRVGGGSIEPHYLIGMRIKDGNRVTPTFHILVKDDNEFRERVKKELEYYLKTVSLIT